MIVLENCDWIYIVDSEFKESLVKQLQNLLNPNYPEDTSDGINKCIETNNSRVYLNLIIGNKRDFR